MKDRQAIVTGKEFTLLKFTTGVFFMKVKIRRELLVLSS